VETRHAVFLEENGCTEVRKMDLEEMRTQDPLLVAQDHYVPIIQFTMTSQVANLPEENTEDTHTLSGHQDAPVTNEHQNVEEPVEEMHYQTADGTQEAQHEPVPESIPIVEPQPLRRSSQERKSTSSKDYVYE
jgi:hypothetical protein